VFAAAVDEFAAHGLAGARVDRIAAAAGVDKKAIYLYFGDKRALFEAVLAHDLESLAEAVPLEGDDVSGYVERLFDYHRQHPAHLRLMLWEALELGADDVPGEAARAAHYRERAEPLGLAQRDGRIDPELDPAGLWLALAGMVTWVFAAPQMTRMVLGHSPSAIDDQRRLLAECARRLADGRRAGGNDMKATT